MKYIRAIWQLLSKLIIFFLSCLFYALLIISIPGAFVRERIKLLHIVLVTGLSWVVGGNLGLSIVCLFWVYCFMAENVMTVLYLIAPGFYDRTEQQN